MRSRRTKWIATVLKAMVVAALMSSTPFTYAQSCEPLGWSPVGGGISGGTNPTVYAMAEFDDGQGGGPALFVAGQFTMAGETPVNNIAKWDGKTWSDVGGGTDNYIRALCVFDDGNGPALYAGGAFISAGQVSAQRVAKWDGTAWTSLGAIDDGEVRALAVHDDRGGAALYAGGTFLAADGVQVNRIAKWDGDSWVGLSTGVNGSVNAMTTYETNGLTWLVATGGFSHAAGQPAQRVAKWDGAWSALPSLGGSNAVGRALASVTYGGVPYLFLGGSDFSIPNYINISMLKWDGAEWSFVFTPNSPSSHYLSDVYSFVVNHQTEPPTLFAMGQSSTVSNNGWAGHVRRWDGSEWEFMGNGKHSPTSSGLVRCGVVTGSGSNAKLYVGGSIGYSEGFLGQGILGWFIADYTDLNRNRIHDICDIENGTSLDCDGNWVPDESQAAMNYSFNMLPQYEAGPAWNGDVLWLNQYNVVPGGEVITAIWLPWTLNIADATEYRLLLYDDPNGDGNPSDAILLKSVVVNSLFYSYMNPSGANTARINVPPTYVGEVGDSFFVGVNCSCLISGEDFPIILRTSPSLQRSWAKIDPCGSLDLKDLSQTPIYQSSYNYIFGAISMDCNGNSTWDACDIDSGVSIDKNNNGLPDECEKQPVCAEDVDGNGEINVDDLLMVINNWGGSGAGDVNGSGVVDVDDLLAVISAWGPCE